MKIQISMYSEPVGGRIVPRTSAEIDISQEEMLFLKKSDKELLGAIVQLIRFSCQYMQSN